MLQGIVTSPPSVNWELLAREAVTHRRVNPKQYPPKFVLPLPVLGIAALTVFLAAALLHYRESLVYQGNWMYIDIFITELCNSAAIIIATATLPTMSFDWWMWWSRSSAWAEFMAAQPPAPFPRQVHYKLKEPGSYKEVTL